MLYEVITEANIGQVPAQTTYQDFLKRQTPEFQDEVLGAARGELFRKGGLKLDQFIGSEGETLTLRVITSYSIHYTKLYE